MKKHISYISWFFFFCIVFATIQSQAQTVITELDPSEKQGERPYEKIWANHKEPGVPTVKFDNLQGWSMQVEGGAQGILQLSRARDIWGRPLARFRYRGNGDKSSAPKITILSPKPIGIPDNADVVEMWAYDDRLPWDRSTYVPPTSIKLNLRDSANKSYKVNFSDLWEEWWLLYRKLPRDMHSAVYLESIEITGGYQEEWLDVFIDSIRFYKEELSPLNFTPLAKRNLTLFEGQDPGANTGPDKLEFPTREETILPMHFSGKYKNEVKSSKEGVYTFKYSGGDSTVSYSFEPAKGLSSIKGYVDGKLVGNLMDKAGIKKADGSVDGNIKKATLKDDTVTTEYDDGTILRLRIWQKSLVLDVINRTSKATELMFGHMSGLNSPRTIAVPFLAELETRDITPCVLLSKAGDRDVFTTILLDWYRSNSSEPFFDKASTTEDTAVTNGGGARYYKRTDGKLNPMYERFFLTVSPMFEEVLPVIPNPVGASAHLAVDRLFQETWGPNDYEKEKSRSRKIRAYGIEKLIQCNHESTWRDGNEGFTMRIHSAPKRGGDKAVKDFVAHQRSLGWFSGLYSNYRDYAPVGGLWDPDAVSRNRSGDWIAAWRRCYSLKPIKAAEFEKKLAPQIRATYNSNSAYTDVFTAVAAWWYTDYDARLPGAGSFAQTYYAWGEVLRNDSKTYGPTFSEGAYQWMYAGLADGSYGYPYSGTPAAKAPLLPVFGLYQIHTKECDIGINWPESFCAPIPDWISPKNIDYAIDRFLVNTLAYGHIGYLVEEVHGIDRTCRSYYMLQQVQSKYGLKRPLRIAYWDGHKLRNVSEAVVLELPKTHRQMYVEYDGGLKLWINDNPTDKWIVKVGDKQVTLPPAGWAAYHQKDGLISYSALEGTGKVDYIKSKAYTYQDGRGKWYETEAAASNGGLAITSLLNNSLQVIRISGKGTFTIKRPYGVKGRLVSCKAYDTDGKKLESPAVSDMSNRTNIKPVDEAIKYILNYSNKP